MEWTPACLYETNLLKEDALYITPACLLETNLLKEKVFYYNVWTYLDEKECKCQSPTAQWLDHNNMVSLVNIEYVPKFNTKITSRWNFRSNKIVTSGNSL